MAAVGKVLVLTTATVGICSYLFVGCKDDDNKNKTPSPGSDGPPAPFKFNCKYDSDCTQRYGYGFRCEDNKCNFKCDRSGDHKCNFKRDSNNLIITSSGGGDACCASGMDCTYNGDDEVGRCRSHSRALTCKYNAGGTTRDVTWCPNGYSATDPMGDPNCQCLPVSTCPNWLKCQRKNQVTGQVLEVLCCGKNELCDNDGTGMCSTYR